MLPNAETDSMGDSQPEEILLDENAEAARYEFYMVGGLEPSPNHKLLAYAEDTSGNEKYTLHVKDIESDREVLKEPIKVSPGAAGSMRGCMLCCDIPVGFCAGTAQATSAVSVGKHNH